MIKNLYSLHAHVVPEHDEDGYQIFANRSSTYVLRVNDFACKNRYNATKGLG